MIKKALIAAAAFLALSTHAGYAQLAAPAGYSSTASGHTYAAASNDRVYGKVVHQAGALTANVGGQAVKMPASYRLAANAPRIAAAAIYLHPGIRTAAAIAAWLGVAAVTYDLATGKWTRADPSAVPSTGYEYMIKSGSLATDWYSSIDVAGRKFAGIAQASSQTHYDPDFRQTWEYAGTFKSAGTNYAKFRVYSKRLGNTTTEIDVRARGSDCPAGWYSTPAGCTQTPQPKELTQQEFVEALNPANQPGWPMPDSVPLELPQGTPLPVEQPFINPAPGENPANRPLRVPTGEPQPIPNTNPQQWRQPYVDIVPAPTPESPWRVDVKPGETTSTNPNPVENPQPDSQDKPAEEQDKSLCEKHPEIAACEKVEVTDKPLPDQPKLYEPKYPDGITGVWNSKLQEIKATPLFNLAPSLLPNVSAGTCPSWKVDLSIDGWTNAGLQDLSPPCWVWDVAKLVIIASALLLARRLIFGG